MKNQKENQMKVFSVKEVNDFKRLCTVHQFKKRAINNNLFGVMDSSYKILEIL